jgi:TRAP transporter TAXI family solute receptor
MRLVRLGIRYGMLPVIVCLMAGFSLFAQDGTPSGTANAQNGYASRKPIFGGACPTCPWGALAEIVQKAVKPSGWDVQICYYCAGGARAARMVAGAMMATPPAKPDADRRPTPTGPVDFGATGTQLLWWAYQGRNDFAKDPEGPRPQLRLIANLQQPSYLLVAVKADSGITDLRQIVDKRMPVKIMASNIIGDTPTLLDYYGLTKEKLESFGGELRMSTSAESRKNPDVIIGWAALVNAPEYNFWNEVTQKYDLKFLSLPDDLRDKLAKQYDFEKRELPLGIYRGVTAPVPTLARTGVVVYSRADMPDDFAYIIAKAMDDRQDLLQWSNSGMNFSYNWHTVWKAYGVPLHPGAARYYKERGYMK